MNLSTHDIKNVLLIHYIWTMLAKYKIQTSYIEFEVTALAYLENFEVANGFLTQSR